MLLAGRAWRRGGGAVRRARHRALDHRVADGGLLARALLRDRRPVVAARAALVDALDRREQLRVHGLHRGAVDRLDGPLHLALVDLLQHVQGRVGDLRARRPLPVHFRARLRRRVRGGLLRRRLLLIVAVLVEHVISAVLPLGGPHGLGPPGISFQVILLDSFARIVGHNSRPRRLIGTKINGNGSYNL